MNRTFLYLLPLILSLSLTSQAQTPTDPPTLTSGQSLEREIASGESHAYQIQLLSGQFVRFRLEQRAIDSLLLLNGVDGKQLVEVNLTGAAQVEPLSLEVITAGNYRLTVRGNGPATTRGSYRLEVSVAPTTTAQDRKRQAAEAALIEAVELRKQVAKTAQQVIEKVQPVVPIWKELGEPWWSAYSILIIGGAYTNLGQFEKTVECSEEALKIYSEIKDRRGEGDALFALGRAFREMGRNDKAIEYSEQALTIYREINDRRGEADALYNAGRAFRDLSRNEKAIEYSEQALAVYRELKNRVGEANVLGILGRAYAPMGKPEKAIEFLEQSLAIYREQKNRVGEASALTNLALVFRDFGRNEESIRYSEQALAIHRELKNLSGEASMLNSMGRSYAALGRTELAIESLESAVRIYRQIKSRLGEATALNNLGIVVRDLGQTEKSIEHYEQARAIAREIKNQLIEADSLILLGRSFAILGRNEKVIEFYEQALIIYRELRNKFGEANALNNLGVVYKDLGRHEKTIEYFEKALPIYREIKNRIGEGTALNNIAIAHRELGRDEKSIEYSEQALTIFRGIKYRLGEGNALFNLAAVNYRILRYEKSSEYYAQTLTIFREIKNPAGEAFSLTNLGVVSRELGRIEEAVKYHEAALRIAREIKSPPSEANSLTQLAKDEVSRGNLVRARSLIEENLAIVETLRADLVSKEDRASYLATVQDLYRLNTDVLMRLHQSEPTKGLDALAFEVSERQRARSLLDLLSEARTDLKSGVDQSLIERERTLAKQINSKAQARVSRELADSLKLEISQLETELERAQADIRKASPHYAALTQPQPLKLKQIQAQLDADTLLLEFSLGEKSSYVWAISRDSLKSYELPKAEEINRRALKVYELLTARSVNKRIESGPERKARITQAGVELPTAASELSQILLSPVAPELGDKRLVIVADGALQYIPFAMLPEPVAGHVEGVTGRQGDGATGRNGENRSSRTVEPLIVRHEVVSLPSASVLAIQRTELASRPKAPKTLAVIADPVFDRSDSRFTTAAADVEKAQPQTIAFNDARSIEHLANGESGARVIPRLPFTRQEATQLLTLTPKDSSFSAIDFRASRSTVLTGDLSQYRYVHFATHGLLDSERPGLSSLVLSMVDREGKPQDGFLRANDIYNLKLPAELVVLSACQTGLGKEVKGEGLVGLTRGFMYAGAARVVVSLWNVNDQATADLMTKFYEKMLKQGQRPAAALRAAQVEMWKQKQWQSPYYWAAFTMQGEWR